jgi:hypothetical protein
MLINLGGVIGGMLCDCSDKEASATTAKRHTTGIRRMANILMSWRSWTDIPLIQVVTDGGEENAAETSEA